MGWGGGGCSLVIRHLLNIKRPRDIKNSNLNGKLEISFIPMTSRKLILWSISKSFSLHSKCAVLVVFHFQRNKDLATVLYTMRRIWCTNAIVHSGVMD